jgi:hypothetical protein
MKSKFHIVIKVFILYSFFFTVGCNVKEEGCLDADAKNFEFTADKACNGCCDYPDIIVSIIHKWGEDNFNPGNIYENNLGQVFSPVQVELFFSQLDMQKNDGEPFHANNWFEAWCLEDNGVPVEKELRNDVAILIKSKFTYIFGEQRQSGLVSKINCLIGLHDSHLCVIPDSLSDAHPLSDNSGLYDIAQDKFSIGRVIVQKDTSLEMLDTIFLHGSAIEFEFFPEQEFLKGGDDVLGLKLDYAPLFEQIDFKNDLDEVISQKITDQIPLILSLN